MLKIIAIASIELTQKLFKKKRKSEQNERKML